MRCPKCSTDAPTVNIGGKRPSERLRNHNRPNGSWCAEGSLMPTSRIPDDPPPVPDWVHRRPGNRTDRVPDPLEWPTDGVRDIYDPRSI